METQRIRRTTHQLPISYRKSHMEFAGINPGSLRWEAGDWIPEVWRDGGNKFLTNNCLILLYKDYLLYFKSSVVQFRNSTQNPSLASFYSLQLASVCETRNTLHRPGMWLPSFPVWQPTEMLKGQNTQFKKLKLYNINQQNSPLLN